jgi:hypothetical protein
MTAIYHRTAGGRVTYIDCMTRDDVANAIARAGWEWSLEPRGFAKWPADRVRGEPVDIRSAADVEHSARTWDRMA